MRIYSLSQTVQEDTYIPEYVYRIDIYGPNDETHPAETYFSNEFSEVSHTVQSRVSTLWYLSSAKEEFVLQPEFDPPNTDSNSFTYMYVYIIDKYGNGDSPITGAVVTDLTQI